MALLPSPVRKHKGVFTAATGALILLVVSAVYGEHGLMHLLRMRAEQRSLEQVTFQLQQKNEHLRERIARLQFDDAYIEKLAHERLGLVKKGEIIYRLHAPSAPPHH